MRAESTGLTDEEIVGLTAIAPLDKWDLQWVEHRHEWITAVTCPKCGEHLQYEVSALTDFYCSACDYDGQEAGVKESPIPASL